MAIQLAVERADLKRLMAFGADAVECQDGGDDEPYAVLPVPVCWLSEAGRVAALTGRSGSSALPAAEEI
jgi:hypothetical protein